MSRKILAWHWLPDDGMTLDHGGMPRTKVSAGTILRVEPPVEICGNGLHGSVKILNALDYAQGSFLERTEHRGSIEQGNDKLCSSIRETLWTLDATWYLHEFACISAEMAIEWSQQKPDPLSIAAINAKRRWMEGGINDKELTVAQAEICGSDRNATCPSDRSAWSATQNRNWSVTLPAAWRSARGASQSAARCAIRRVTGSVAQAAAHDSAQGKLNTILTRMINDAPWEKK